MSADAAGAAPAPAVPSGGRRWVGWVAGAAAVAAAASPWWGPLILREFSFFHVRHVEVHGLKHLGPQVVVDRLRVDTTRSVWDGLVPYEARIAGHPLVEQVRVRRRLPATLVVDVEEVVPVALAPGPGGLRAYDGEGRVLPIDLATSVVDAPVLGRRDTALLSLLARVQLGAPDLYARLDEVRGDAAGELVLRVGRLPVRAMAQVTPERLAEILPVVRDLDARGLRARELDLRYRDQVVARLP